MRIISIDFSSFQDFSQTIGQEIVQVVKMCPKYRWILLVISVLVVSTGAFIRHPEKNPQIIDGEDADELCGEEYPFHAHLNIRNITGVVRTSVGSGVLISTTLVLTLADNIHCNNEWMVGFGNLNRHGLVWHTTTNGQIHPNYIPEDRRLEFNIGVLIFSTSVVTAG